MDYLPVEIVQVNFAMRKKSPKGKKSRRATVESRLVENDKIKFVRSLRLFFFLESVEREISETLILRIGEIEESDGPPSPVGNSSGMDAISRER